MAEKLFTLKAPIIIKNKDSGEWSETLEKGRIGYVNDEHYMVCGNGAQSTYIDSANEAITTNGRISWNGSQFVVNDLPRMPGFIIAPMFGYMYDEDGNKISKVKDNTTYTVEKRTGADYAPVEGAILFLYDNRADFKEPDVINPEYIE